MGRDKGGGSAHVGSAAVQAWASLTRSGGAPGGHSRLSWWVATPNRIWAWVNCRYGFTPTRTRQTERTGAQTGEPEHTTPGAHRCSCRGLQPGWAWVA